MSHYKSVFLQSTYSLVGLTTICDDVDINILEKNTEKKWLLRKLLFKNVDIWVNGSENSRIFLQNTNKKFTFSPRNNKKQQFFTYTHIVRPYQINNLYWTLTQSFPFTFTSLCVVIPFMKINYPSQTNLNYIYI